MTMMMMMITDGIDKERTPVLREAWTDPRFLIGGYSKSTEPITTASER